MRIVIDGQPLAPSANSFATGPHLPDPDAGRGRGEVVDETHVASFATGTKCHPLMKIPTRTLDDPPDPYGPEGDLVGDDVYAGAAEILRQRYQTLPDGQPSGRIIVEG